MTREEAIRMIERIKDRINWEVVDSQKKMDALNMAIKSLETWEKVKKEIDDSISVCESDAMRDTWCDGELAGFLQSKDIINRNLSGGERMTREEAIARLKVLTDYEYDEDLEALEMAIEALEQQPCEDCISRQAVINCVTSNEFRYKIVEDIKTLPSVTPKEKTGKWIDDGFYAEGHSEIVYRCSQCNHCIIELSIEEYNFCPNCGARMVEPQESEVSK